MKYLLLVPFLFLFLSCTNQVDGDKKTSQETTIQIPQNDHPNIADINNTEPKGRNQLEPNYTHKEMNLSFSVPNTLKSDGEEVKSIDLSGKTRTIEANFIDSSSETSLIVKYRPKPNSVNIYNDKLSLLNSSKEDEKSEYKQINVGETPMIVIESSRTHNGKGTELNQAESLVIIHFLDEKSKNGYEFQFRSPTVNKEATWKLINKMLDSISFLDK